MCVDAKLSRPGPLESLVRVPLVDFGTLPPVAFVTTSLVALVHTVVTGVLMPSLAANTTEGVGVSKLLGFFIIALVAEPL
jgi:fluoroquinolone transport system permease protein